MRILLKLLGIFIAVGMLFIIGVFSYKQLEGWSYTDSFYFTGVTLLTIGYGDLHPTTPEAKIFTVFFGFTGIGVVLVLLTIMSQYFIEQQDAFRIRAQARATSIARNVISKHKKRMSSIRRSLLKGSR